MNVTVLAISMWSKLILQSYHNQFICLGDKIWYRGRESQPNWQLKRQGRPLQFWVRQKTESDKSLGHNLAWYITISAYLQWKAIKKVPNEAFSGCSIIFDQILSLLTVWFLVFLLFLPYFCYFSWPFTVRHHLQSDTRGVHGRPGRPLIYAPDHSYDINLLEIVFLDI